MEAYNRSINFQMKMSTDEFLFQRRMSEQARKSSVDNTRNVKRQMSAPQIIKYAYTRTSFLTLTPRGRSFDDSCPSTPANGSTKMHDFLSKTSSTPSLSRQRPSNDDRIVTPSQELAPQPVLTLERVKQIYDFLLFGLLLEFLIAPSCAAYLSSSDKHAGDHHGFEYTQALLLVTGWVLSLTWKNVSWWDHMTMVLTHLLPFYSITMAITAIATALDRQQEACVSQLLLETLTLGAWNPALLWSTYNRPLWLLSTMLSFLYVAPAYLRWIRRMNATQLAATFGLLYAIRACIIVAMTVAILPEHAANPRVLCVWAPSQVWIPAMGAVLHQLGRRCRMGMTCLDTRAIWLATGCVVATWLAKQATTVLLISFASFVPGVDLGSVQGIIDETDGLTSAAIPVAVFLLMCADNTFGTLTSLRQLDVEALCGSGWMLSACACLRRVQDALAAVLAVSHVVYLWHWPVLTSLRWAGVPLHFHGCQTIVWGGLVLAAACVEGPLQEWATRRAAAGSAGRTQARPIPSCKSRGSHGGWPWPGPDPKGRGGGTPSPLYGPQNCRTEQCALGGAGG